MNSIEQDVFWDFIGVVECPWLLSWHMERGKDKIQQLLPFWERKENIKEKLIRVFMHPNSLKVFSITTWPFSFHYFFLFRSFFKSTLFSNNKAQMYTIYPWDENQNKRNLGICLFELFIRVDLNFKHFLFYIFQIGSINLCLDTTE